MTPRALTTPEITLIRWIVDNAVDREVRLTDVELSSALVTRYDESECLRFVRPRASDVDLWKTDDSAIIELPTNHR